MTSWNQQLAKGMVSITKEAEGVYRIRLKGPIGDIGHVNLYLLEQEENSAALVDAGFYSSANEIIEAIHTVLGKDARINNILLTHLHYDHYGSANQLAARFSAEILMHERERLIVDIIESMYLDRDRRLVNFLQLPEKVAEKVYRVIGREIEIYPKNTKTVGGGTVIKSKSGEWALIHTPGHTPGHVCLFNRETGVLISGDHLLPNETSNVAYYPAEGYNPLLEFLLSLKKVESLKPALLLPSHGDAFTNVGERVSFLFQHHEARLQEVMEGIREENDITGVARHVKWSRGEFDSLADFDKWLAILETLSHAEFLVSCGVARRSLNNKLRYEIVDDSFDKVATRIRGIYRGSD